MGVPYQNYIIDVGIIMSENGLQCVVIELNPFAVTTGACLFDWKKDKMQLTHGKEIEMRVHHKRVITQNFVDGYLNDFDEYSVEKPWFQRLDEMEAQINANQEIKNDHQKKDCII